MDQKAPQQFIISSDEIETAIIYENFEPLQKQIEQYEVTCILNELVKFHKKIIPFDIDQVFNLDDITDNEIKQPDFDQWILDDYCKEDLRKINSQIQELDSIKQQCLQSMDQYKGTEFQNINLCSKLESCLKDQEQLKKKHDILQQTLQQKLSQLQQTKIDQIVDQLSQYRLNQLKCQDLEHIQEFQKTEIVSQKNRQTKSTNQLHHQRKSLEIVNDSNIINDFIGKKEFTLSTFCKVFNSQSNKVKRFRLQIKKNQQKQNDLSNEISKQQKYDKSLLEDLRVNSQIDLKQEIHGLQPLRNQFNQVLNEHKKIVDSLNQCQEEMINVENEQHQIQQTLHITRPNKKSSMTIKNVQVLGLGLLLTGLNYIVFK